MIFALVAIGYFLVVWSIIRMFRKYEKRNWIWLIPIIIGLPFGIGPFIALAYLLVTRNNKNNNNNYNNVVYNSDGSYTVYKSAESLKGPSTGKIIFKVISGIIIAGLVAFGLLVIAFLVALAIKPANSKSM